MATPLIPASHNGLPLHRSTPVRRRFLAPPIPSVFPLEEEIASWRNASSVMGLRVTFGVLAAWDVAAASTAIADVQLAFRLDIASFGSVQFEKLIGPEQRFNFTSIGVLARGSSFTRGDMLTTERLNVLPLDFEIHTNDQDNIFIRLPPLSTEPNRCECAFVGNTIEQANGVYDKPIDLPFCDYTNEKFNLKGKSLATALMSDAKFDGADPSEVVMSKVYPAGASFKGVDFSNEVLDRMNFEKANLQGALFTNMVLS